MTGVTIDWHFLLRDVLYKAVWIMQWMLSNIKCKQESPAIADKPARRESLQKIAQIRRAYNVVADNTGLSSFV